MGVTGATHRIVITGDGAAVRLGYQTAATLGAWRVEGGWFTAAVVTVDRFRLTQSPLTLEVRNKDGTTTRRGLEDVTVYQGQFSARLVSRR